MNVGGASTGGRIWWQQGFNGRHGELVMGMEPQGSRDWAAGGFEGKKGSTVS